MVHGSRRSIGRDGLAYGEHAFDSKALLSRSQCATEGTLEEVRDTSSFAFELPRGPRSDESAWVYVSYPALDVTGEPTGNNSYFNVRGKAERHPESWVAVVSFDQIKMRTRDLPLKVTGFLGFKSSVKMNFTPYWKAGRKR